MRIYTIGNFNIYLLVLKAATFYDSHHFSGWTCWNLYVDIRQDIFYICNDTNDNDTIDNKNAFQLTFLDVKKNNGFMRFLNSTLFLFQCLHFERKRLIKYF